jgi:hypothetical protein
VRAGELLVGPGAAAALAVMVVEASRVTVLGSRVPGQAWVVGLELPQGHAAQAAELPIRVETDLVQQAGSAQWADPGPDLAESVAPRS